VYAGSKEVYDPPEQFCCFTRHLCSFFLNCGVRFCSSWAVDMSSLCSSWVGECSSLLLFPLPVPPPVAAPLPSLIPRKVGYTKISTFLDMVYEVLGDPYCDCWRWNALTRVACA